MSVLTDNALVPCPKCGRNATAGWVRYHGQCGACGAREEKARVRALDVSPTAIAARLHERFARRPAWAKEDGERDHEIRALLAALGVEA